MVASSSIAIAACMESDSNTQKLHRRAAFANFPFDPARLSFFYGTVVLACGTLGVLEEEKGSATVLDNGNS